MTDQTPPPPAPYATPAAPMTGGGQPGQIRSTGMSIVLFIVTLSIYGYVYYFKTADERKRYSGNGLGGGVSLLIAIIVSPVMAFLAPSEIGNLQTQYGQQKTVSGTTGFWIFLPLVGGLIWFAKTNGAINDFWRSQGVQG